jgi:hypothetical protein
LKKLIVSIALLAALMLIDIVGAITVSVTCNPQQILPGQTTTITVTSDAGGSGSITVITPQTHTSSAVSITIPPGGGSVSKVYPTDFGPSASTSEVGEYQVIVVLSGYKYTAYFWVSFTVVPQTPIGVIAAIAACFAALGVKRIQVKREK